MSPASKEQILIVDDDETQCELLALSLKKLGYETQMTTSPSDSLKRIENENFAAILTDVAMNEMDGIELTQKIIERRPHSAIVVITGNGNIETAITAMRAGAYDFLVKPIDSNVLGLSVGRAVQAHRMKNEIKALKSSLHASGLHNLHGESQPIQRLVELVKRVADSDASVFIHGETGTGKELVARAVHLESNRRDAPFVAINCAAVPATLLDSELFGHARGAFTDAKVARDGLFVQSHQGTLFLDEIGEMPMEMQAKLLRALQERRVRPVGSNAEISFDTRIVSASHRDLEHEVEAGRFREDLFYRINVVTLEVPALRDREGDILRLAHHFLSRAAERTARAKLNISQAAAELLMSYPWPGNVRELENAMERAVALAHSEEVVPNDLPLKVREYQASAAAMSVDVPQVVGATPLKEPYVLSLEEVERRHILRTIEQLGGNKALAATLLGLDRRTLYRRLEKYQIYTHNSDASP